MSLRFCLGSRIRFLGGANTVTGSKYLVTHNDSSVLVDCGLFQGLKTLRMKNWDDLDVDPRSIDAIILTHAHLDHSGYIPRFIKQGFKGKIYCTDATLDLCQILLNDAGHLMEEEAEYLNKNRRSKHRPALPLFTEKDADKAIEQFEPVKVGDRISIGTSFEFEFVPVGHILGACAVLLEAGQSRIAFSGDVGRLHDSLLPPPRPLHSAEYLVVESTYGNRLHPPLDSKIELQRIVTSVCGQGGTVLIPAFAVGRTQTILFELTQLKKENRIPQVPIYLNSPMASKVNGLMKKYMSLHRLTLNQVDELQKMVTTVETAEDSKKLNESSTPKVIVAGSGMLDGGRILHHLKAFGPSSNNCIVLSGFQASGTRGAALLNGAKELKIHGAYVPMAVKVENLTAISAHADFSEMISWLKDSPISPKKVFVTHGEPSASDEFRRRLNETFAWNCLVPQQDESFELE